MPAVIGRFGRILLGLILLLQAGPTCACAIEHVLTCGDSDGAVADGLTGSSRCCDDPGCTALTSCPRHSDHHSPCSVRALSELAKQQASNIGPAVAHLCSLTVFPPAEGSHARAPFNDPPDLPVGSARSLPLLI